MYYEISVFKKERCYFVINNREILELVKAQELYNDILVRFPTSEGFTVEVDYLTISGQSRTKEFAQRLINIDKVV